MGARRSGGRAGATDVDLAEKDFDEFYLATARRVVGQVFAVTGNLGEAEDAVAEAYIRAWQRWQTVSVLESPEAWVRRVALRIAVSSWRKATNRIRAHGRAAPRESLVGPGPDHVALVAALRQIAPTQRRAVVLHHLAGLSVQEVADEIGAPVGTVKAQLARGRAALATVLSEVGETDSSRGGIHGR